MSLTLRWKRLYPAGRLSQLSWARTAAGEEFPLHDHDFPEFFWIPEGEVEHTINGQTSQLGRGDLMFVRAADRHRFVGRGERGAVIANFAVRADLVAHLRRRYFPQATDAWWTTAPVPPRLALSAADLHALAQAAREFALHPQPDLLSTERFLLNLFEMLRQHDAPHHAAAEPDWLGEARRAMGESQHLAGGVRRLARLAGCSPEHLARTVRRVHGVTPTDLVNRQRLDWAGSELMFTGREIAEVALAAGFESLSHFYHLFRQRHGVTPRQFRLRARALT
jgi:AraC family cel operon transcriptional repressor